MSFRVEKESKIKLDATEVVIFSLFLATLLAVNACGLARIIKPLPLGVSNLSLSALLGMSWAVKRGREGKSWSEPLYCMGGWCIVAVIFNALLFAKVYSPRTCGCISVSWIGVGSLAVAVSARDLWVSKKTQAPRNQFLRDGDSPVSPVTPTLINDSSVKRSPTLDEWRILFNKINKREDN